LRITIPGRLEKVKEIEVRGMIWRGNLAEYLFQPTSHEYSNLNNWYDEETIKEVQKQTGLEDIMRLPDLKKFKAAIQCFPGSGTDSLGTRINIEQTLWRYKDTLMEYLERNKDRSTRGSAPLCSPNPSFS
jgi:hypothetical protein